MTEKEKRKNPLYLLREIEAFCCFKCDGIGPDDVVELLKSVQDCLDANCNIVIKDNGMGRKWKTWEIAGLSD